MEHLFLAHFVSTLFMSGLCWFVQIVHYPLFRHIPLADFIQYERKNVLFTAIVAIPVMVIESLSGVYLLYYNPNLLNWLNMLLFSVIAVSTFILQAPLHVKLMVQPSTQLVNRLIRSNWLRTLSWSIRCVILTYMVYSLK